MKTRIFLVLLSLIGLAACGDDGADNAPPPNIVITIQPQPRATVVPGCEMHDLESWYEVAGTLVQTFKQDSQNGLGRSPEETASVLNRLIDLRDTIAAQPVPECALTVHSEILLEIRAMLTAYQRYVNGDLASEDLRTQIDAGGARIDTEIAALLSGTQAGLEQQLRDERATESAATPAQ